MKLILLLPLLLFASSASVMSYELPWLTGNNVQGNFIQEKHLAALKRPFVTKGQYAFNLENGLTWHTLTPVDNQLIIDQQGIAEVQTDGSLKTLTSNSSFSAMLLALFSADVDSIKSQFNLLPKDNGLSLVPLDPQILTVIKGLDLEISNQILQKITLHESNGNLTHIFLLPASDPMVTE